MGLQNFPRQVVVPNPNRLSLSIAGTAAVALASLPLAVSPAAAKVSEGTTSSIGVIETSSDVQQFNLKPQSASTVLVVQGASVGVETSRGRRGGGIRVFLNNLLVLLGFSTPGNRGGVGTTKYMELID
jgi:hypothetical protein